MSLTVGSLSSGSSGPRPVISSRISETNSLSSWVFSASRSLTVYCVTSRWMCCRISSSGSFSSAERLISSISRRCSRTLASRYLSECSGLTGSVGSLVGSGIVMNDMTGTSAGLSAGASAAAGSTDRKDSGSDAATGAGSEAKRRAEKRPAMVMSFRVSNLPRKLRPGTRAFCGAISQATAKASSSGPAHRRPAPCRRPAAASAS